MLDNMPNSSMRKSPSNRNILSNDYPDDVGYLKVKYIERNDELKDLNLQIAQLEKLSEAKSQVKDNQSQQTMQKLEGEYRQLVIENQNMSVELSSIQEQIKTQTNEFESKFQQMKAKFQESAKRNTEMYERELTFKYRNNDEETVKFLQQKIAEMESKQKKY